MNQIVIIGLLVCFLGFTRAFPVKNVSHQDPLTNLGHISMKIVEHIAQAQDEELDMSKLSEFVMALAEATAVVKHPEVCI